VKRIPGSTKLTVLSAWGSRLASAGVTIFSLRLLSQALGPGDYAFYVVIVGLTGWLALSDLGIGYAVQNAAAERLAHGQPARGVIQSAYLLLVLLTAILLAATFAFRHALAGFLLAQMPSLRTGNYALTFWLSCSTLVLLAMTSVAGKILYATGKGHLANIGTAAGAALGLVVLQLGIGSSSAKVAFAMVAMYGPTILIYGVFAVRQFGSWSPASLHVWRQEASAILASAKGFLAFNVVAAAVLQIDYIILSQKASKEEIIQYYTISKLFGILSFFNQAILLANWSNFTRQFALGELAHAERLVRRIMAASAVATVAFTLLLLASKDHLGPLLAPGSGVSFRYSVIGGFAALALARCITDPCATFLQSIGRVRPLILFAVAQAVIGGGLQWLLAGSLGAEGVLIALTLSFLSTVVWGLPMTARRLLSR
jgi:O-antigen/teichoic acid export membrane protein